MFYRTVFLSSDYDLQDLHKPVGAILAAYFLNGRLPTVGALGEVAPQVLKSLVSAVEQANCVSLDLQAIHSVLSLSSRAVLSGIEAVRAGIALVTSTVAVSAN
jgi:hypothetical protein